MLKQIISARGVFLLIGTVVFFSSGPAAAQTLEINSVEKYNISGMPEGLGGLTWAGGNQYYAIEDSGAKLHPMTIDVNSFTGGIGLVTFVSHITLTGGSDLEGVAYNAANNSVYVSDEEDENGNTDARIMEYSITGTYLSSVNIPSVYDSRRHNLSLESLSLQAGHLSMWTVNEEALTCDGPVSTPPDGTVVRLQKFDSNLNPVGQWAYLTDPLDSTVDGDECCGVCDLCVLPNGKLLVLERELNGEGALWRFENRIYEIDFTNATDVSEIDALEGASYTLVTKHLLWEGGPFLWDNFEGLALGPQLDNGDYSLLMISDGDGSWQDECLYALRLSGDVPEPATLALLMCGGCAALMKRRRR